MRILLRTLLVAAVAMFLPPSYSRAAAPRPPDPITPPPPPAPLPETPRNLVAAHYAPTLFQETRDVRDLMVAFDFDGDWDGSNNAAHLDAYPARAVLYFTVAETPTHYLVTYVVYHAVDAKFGSGHDHDSEHLTLAIRKDGTRWGHLEAMETRFHGVLYQYAGRDVGDGADDVDGPIHLGDDGRPEVYVQRVGHGLCGGYAPTALIDTFALRCEHREAPHIHDRGVVYRYRGAADVPRSLDDRDAGYALVEIGDSLWEHAHEAGPHATFGSLMDFRGERCGRFLCPHGIGRELNSRPHHGSTGMPWEEGGGRGVASRGDAFLDPAFTLARRLRFAQPFSTEYLYNPYLGVGAFGPPEPIGPAVAEKAPVQGAPAASPPRR